MSTKKHYNLTITVATLRDLTEGLEKTKVDISVHGIQTVQQNHQFGGLNTTESGYRSAGNFSAFETAFALFALDTSSLNDSLHGMTYNAVGDLIGTEKYTSMAVLIPPVVNPNTTDVKKKVDMALLVNGIILGLKDAMKHYAPIAQISNRTLYFVVPIRMKKYLKNAIDELE